MAENTSKGRILKVSNLLEFIDSLYISSDDNHDLNAIEALHKAGLNSLDISNGIKNAGEIGLVGLDKLYNRVDMLNLSIDSPILKRIKKANNIAIVGDGNTSGVGVTDMNNVWSYNLKEYIRKIKKLDNIGFQTMDNTFNHYHTVVPNSGAWVKNYTNINSINGFSYDSNIAGSYITVYTPINNQTQAIVYFTGNNSTSTIEIYLNDTLIDTMIIDASSDMDIITSATISLSSSVNNIKIVLVTGVVSISGIKYSNNINSGYCDIHATTDRHINDITEDVLSEYNIYDLMMFGLSTDDMIYATDVDKQTINTILTSISINYIFNNKTFIYLNLCWGVEDENNWILNKLLELYNSYANFYIIDVKQIFTNDTGLLADDTYRVSTLKEFNNSKHPNDLGHVKILDYISNNIFNKNIHIKHTNDNIVCENNSIYTKYNNVGVNTYGSTILGMNNKTNDGSKYLTTLGIGNTSNDDSTVCIGEYNTINMNNSLLIGFNNTVNRSNTYGIGSNIFSNNCGVVYGFSSNINDIRQSTRQIRKANTNNDIEALLVASDSSVLIYTIVNTITILKGRVIGYSSVDTSDVVYEIDCTIINKDGVITLKEGVDTNSGVRLVRNQLAEIATCRVITNGNTYSIGVVGILESIKWLCGIEMIEVNI